MCVFSGSVFVEWMGQNAQKQIQPVTMTLAHVSVEQRRIDGVGHIIYVTWAKFALWKANEESVQMQMFQNNTYHEKCIISKTWIEN